MLRKWLLEKELQLIVSPEVIDEYLEIFEDILGFDQPLVEAWRQRFENDGRSTFVFLGPRFEDSQDPDDNIMLAAAVAGDADYLLTNDKDLLDLPIDVRKQWPFLICTPSSFLRDLVR